MIDLALFYRHNPWHKGNLRDEKLISREIEESIFDWMSEKEILLIKGARQVGKSTLMRQIIEDLISNKKIHPQNIFYFTFDDQRLRDSVKKDPNNLLSFVGSLASKNDKLYIFLDEIQKISELFEIIKIAFDEGSSHKFILSGSSLLGLTKGAASALTGRTIDFNLYPLTINEIFNFKFPDIKKKLLKKVYFKEMYLSFFEWEKRHKNAQNIKSSFEKIIDEYFETGGYPRIFMIKDITRKHSLARNIKEDYLEKDIQGLIKKEKLYSFQQLFDLLAFQIGNLINYQELGAQVSITYKTLRNFISLMENTHILFLLLPFGRGRRNLIKKNPKVYFNDIGIRNVSLNFQQIIPVAGAAVENLVFNSFKWLNSYQNFKHNLYFLRTTAGSEVDFIIEYGKEIIPIEVKYSSFRQPTIPRALLGLLESYNIPKGIVITKDLLAQRKINNREIMFIPLWLWMSAV